MKELTPEQKKLIARPLPADAVKKHPTRPGMSAIKAIYVTERLNDVFGVGGWQLRTDLIPVGENGFPFSIKVYDTSGGKKRTEYFAVSKTTLSIPDYGIHYECIAGASNDDMGDASKGSITDSVTKIASYMGIGIDVFKGQHDQALADYDRQEAASRSSELHAEMTRAIARLSTCNTVPELGQLRDSLGEGIVTSASFKKAATDRYNQLTTPAA